ncbi:MAG: 3-phosphoserine/phosphohydroxythreonine transaminase [Gammaproteobacteria bacterium]|nr:3-phosphoserine/phosphohydroxythreonine transaminase [Gammaproteobacteria bacterium]
MSPYNFAAGPSSLPAPVLEAARAGFENWDGSGQSVMEIPFTGSEYESIHDNAVEALTRILKIPDGYRVLFMQGGAYGQFSILPMNLLRGADRADYVVTGHWSRRAAQEALKYCSVNIVADGENSNYLKIPDRHLWSLNCEAAYCHITTNETANGVQFHTLPDTGDVPLVADVTSDFLTAPLDISRLGAIYASAQKNIGIAGLTLVVVRESLLGDAMPITPSVFDYSRLATCKSKVNTPPVWAIYIAGLMFRWIESEGGLEEMSRRNANKAEILYEMIGNSDYYSCNVERQDRSLVNVCFALPSPVLEMKFLESARASGFLNLEGHSAAGGVRASLYNAVSEAAVVALTAFMDDFQRLESRVS